MLTGTSDVNGDTVKNRLDIRLDGFQGPFDVVTDITTFVPGSPKAADAPQLGGGLVERHGRRRAVRVTGGVVTGLMQFNRLIRGAFDEDESVRCASPIAEADRILDDW
jgi:hypothetical protein